MQGLVVNSARFGNGSFQFNADAGPLYKPFAIFWFLVLGLVLAASLLLFVVLAPNMVGEIDPMQEAEHQRMFLATYFGVILIGVPIYLVLSAWYRHGGTIILPARRASMAPTCAVRKGAAA